MGTAFGGAGVEPGTTIDEAIKDQQKWLEDKAATEKAQEELKAKIEAENAAVKTNE